jgi:hypothetical protein
MGETKGEKVPARPHTIARKPQIDPAAPVAVADARETCKLDASQLQGLIEHKMVEPKPPRKRSHTDLQVTYEVMDFESAVTSIATVSSPQGPRHVAHTLRRTPKEAFASLPVPAPPVVAIKALEAPVSVEAPVVEVVEAPVVEAPIRADATTVEVPAIEPTLTRMTDPMIDVELPTKARDVLVGAAIGCALIAGTWFAFGPLL